MRVLLDTHAFLWWVMDNDRLSNRVREIILDRNNQVFFSAASAWELAIKVGTGKLTLPEPIEIYIPTRLANNGFEALAIEVRHTLQVASLPDYHRDPFDRILIAQCLVDNLTIASCDAQIIRYPVQQIW